VNSLASLQCTPLTVEDSIALNPEKINDLLLQLDPHWQLETAENSISHTFNFKNYYQTMAFVNVIAQIAHQQNHHPDISFSYKQCTITYSTHDVAALSKKDFICATKINQAQNL